MVLCRSRTHRVLHRSIVVHRWLDAEALKQILKMAVSSKAFKPVWRWQVY